MAERATTLTTLRRARELLSESGRWVKGASARSVSNDIVHPTSKAACCWCLIGALYHVTNGDSLEHEDELCSAFGMPERSACFEMLAAWNDADERTHAEVLDAFDRAITALEERDHG